MYGGTSLYHALQCNSDWLGDFEFLRLADFGHWKNLNEIGLQILFNELIFVMASRSEPGFHHDWEILAC